MQGAHPRDSLHPWVVAVGEEVAVPLLKVVEVPAVVEEEEGHPCSLGEVLLVGPQRAQQGGLGKENLEGKRGA